MAGYVAGGQAPDQAREHLPGLRDAHPNLAQAAARPPAAGAAERRAHRGTVHYDPPGQHRAGRPADRRGRPDGRKDRRRRARPVARVRADDAAPHLRHAAGGAQRGGEAAQDHLEPLRRRRAEQPETRRAAAVDPGPGSAVHRRDRGGPDGPDAPRRGAAGCRRAELCGFRWADTELDKPYRDPATGEERMGAVLDVERPIVQLGGKLLESGPRPGPGSAGLPRPRHGRAAPRAPQGPAQAPAEGRRGMARQRPGVLPATTAARGTPTTCPSGSRSWPRRRACP